PDRHRRFPPFPYTPLFRSAAPATSADTGALKSYAGAAPANADALAAAHKAYPATLPAAPAGPVADVHLVLKDVTVQIAPGIRYRDRKSTRLNSSHVSISYA